MKIYPPNGKGWRCGFWNDNTIGIYQHQNRHQLYVNEKLHFHPNFYEYYIVLEGSLEMVIDNQKYHFQAGTICCVFPKEIHRITSFGKEGCLYMVIKSKSYPNSTIPVLPSEPNI